MKSTLAAALGLLLLPFAAIPALAQEGEKPEAPAPAPDAVPAPAAETKPVEAAKPTDAADAAEIERITGEMMQKIEVIRGLKFKHDVKRVWKSREEAKAEMLEGIDKEIPPAKVLAISREMGLFGLIPEGGNIKEIFSEFISSGAGGYYISETKTFSLVRGFSEDASRPIVFHELVHAVEDQYYDYSERSKKYSDADQGDGAAAIQAVVEGSARYWEDAFVASEPGLRKKYFQANLAAQAGDDTMQKQMELPPAIVIGMVMYPYGNGCDFHQVLMAETKAASDHAWFDTIYADPPSSTEQVLHPLKYVQGDLPQVVKLPEVGSILGEGWEPLGEETQGELTTGLVINATLLPNNMIAQAAMAMRMPKAGMSPDEAIRFQMTPIVQFKGDAAKAAEGWDGDRYEVLAKGERLCLCWVSTWDTPMDAQEFAEIYGKVIRRKYGVVSEVDGKKTRTPPESSEFKVGEAAGTRWVKTREGDSAIVVEGNLVVVVERCPADNLEALVSALLKSEIVRDPKDTLPAK